jgi:A1 cistron-splicing factor AAR2
MMMNDSRSIYNLEYRLQSGVLLLLNCPGFMQFGIDYSSWTIGDKFKGIKLIPDGAHFIYYSLKEEEYSFKQGFFIYVGGKNKIHIRTWDNEIKDFVALKNEEDEKSFSIGINNLDFDAYLGEYPQDQVDNWRDLTKFIDNKILDRLEPINRRYITTSKEYAGGNDSQNSIKGNIYYTSIPKNKFYLNKVDPSFLTQSNLDKSIILEELIIKEYSNDHCILLAEFQYSFITFFLGEIYESFEQWKNIFILICSCKELIGKREKLFCDFIETVYHQLRQLPKDFFIDELSNNNFIGKMVELLFDNCCEVSDAITKRIKLLTKFLKEYFGFEIKNENEKIIENYLIGKQQFENFRQVDYDDEMPTIVEENEISKNL